MKLNKTQIRKAFKNANIMVNDMIMSSPDENLAISKKSYEDGVITVDFTNGYYITLNVMENLSVDVAITYRKKR